ncbi:hypothetical protein B0H13DRAFT_1891259 [Mycena leptocephala]|nr:hypothetical protein B0H13DRAFT_1891259 [Mycena leptocephala]
MFDDNPKKTWSRAHLTRFRNYRDYVRKRSDDDETPLVQPPTGYDDWVFQLRAIYDSDRPELPPFSLDYEGAVPNVNSPVDTPALAPVPAFTPSTSEDFARIFMQNQMAFVSRATNMALNMGETMAMRSSFQYRGRGRNPGRNNTYSTRQVDTYFGPTIGLKRTRSRSPDERVVRRRDHSEERDYRSDAGRVYREDSREYRSQAGPSHRSDSRDYARSSTYRSPSPGDHTPRGRRDDRTPVRRPSSRSMDAVARRSLERQLRNFQKDREADLAKKRQHERASEDVEMTPAPPHVPEDLIDLTDPARLETSLRSPVYDPATDKGKKKDPAEGPGLPATSTSGGNSAVSGTVDPADLAFLELEGIDWALDEDGNALPALPTNPDDEF